MKNHITLFTIFFLSLYCFAQDSIKKNNTEIDVEYENVIEFEKRYKTIFEEQSSEYEYEYSDTQNTSVDHTGKTSIENTEVSKSRTLSKKHDPSIREIDSLWISELYNNNLHNDLLSDGENYNSSVSSNNKYFGGKLVI